MNAGEKVNILLVDDQPAKLLSYEAILAGLGENLIKATSGREALDHLLRTEITVVLMDVSMPELDGFELASIIRQHPRFRRTAIIFVSAVHLTDLDRLKGYEVGAVDYVSVPVVPEILRAKVSVFTELHRKTRELDRLNQELEHRVAERTAELESSAVRLRASEERFRIMAEMMPSIIWTAAPDGTITYANRRWSDYCGSRLAGERLNWPPERAIHPDDLERFGAETREHLREGRAYETEVRLRRHDGEFRWFVTLAAPRHDEHGKVLGWFGITTDINDRKEMSERLREADRRKDEFLAVLAHELRNPLAPIGNAIQLMREIGVSEQLAWCHNVIERQVTQLVRLVDDLLDVSRITRGKIRLEKEAVDLAVVVGNAIEMSRPLIDRHEHVLIAVLPVDPVIVEGDPARLTQVVANLLNNAAKYQEPGGHIRVRVERDGHEAVIGVEDQGIGIARERLSSVFEMFAQEAAPLDRAHGGLGIGLSLVRTLVEMHGGSVRALSEGAGRGSEFIVRLPCQAGQPSMREVSAAASERSAEPSLSILVVDDNRDAAEMLSTLLGQWGHDVAIAHDGASALQIAAARHPSVILLDIGLPNGNGYDVCRLMRDQGLVDSTIVALTGFGQEGDRRRSSEAGFDQHLVKPIATDTLRTLVANAVASRSPDAMLALSRDSVQ
ncbi:MAG: hybrid sensor histidine kinase/response regulator [Longimicrobiales bacterium]